MAPLLYPCLAGITLAQNPTALEKINVQLENLRKIKGGIQELKEVVLRYLLGH